MTKAVFAGAVKKAIPIIGAGIGFATTFFTFKSCCNKFRKTLRDTYLYNKDKVEAKDELIIDATTVVED